MSWYHRYWATHERVRGRHAEHRDDLLRVADVLAAAIAEGRPVELAWPDHDSHGLVHDAPQEPLTRLTKS